MQRNLYSNAAAAIINLRLIKISKFTYKINMVSRINSSHRPEVLKLQKIAMNVDLKQLMNKTQVKSVKLGKTVDLNL